jgi:hypothetical protein
MGAACVQAPRVSTFGKPCLGTICVSAEVSAAFDSSNTGEGAGSEVQVLYCLRVTLVVRRLETTLPWSSYYRYNWSNYCTIAESECNTPEIHMALHCDGVSYRILCSIKYVSIALWIMFRTCTAGAAPAPAAAACCARKRRNRRNRRRSCFYTRLVPARSPGAGCRTACR